MPPDQLSTTPVAAAMLYRQGVELLVSGRSADSIPLFHAAVAIEGDFALAHAALAVAQAEVGCTDGWRAAIDRASAQRNISRCERQHVAVIAVALAGSVSRASALGREHLHEFPNDDVVAHLLTSRGTEFDDRPVS